MFESHDHAILEICREKKLVDLATLNDLDDEHKSSGKPLADVLIDMGVVTRSALLQAIAAHLLLPYLEELPPLGGEVVVAVKPNIARDYGVIPIRVDAQSIDLAATDPFNNQIIDDLTFALGKDVNLVVADPLRIDALIKLHYGDDEVSLDDLLKDLSTEGGEAADGKELSEKELAELANNTPIVKFVNLVLTQAVKDKSSDVHFEPFEHEFKIRYRIDGALFEMTPPPKHLALPITSRVKVLANLNIAERRIPQDGRIKLTIAGRPVDLRVSTLPTQFGESVVLRVLDQSAVRLEISDLGMAQNVYEEVTEIIKRPNGIFIVTGPTGCGKTTTLYSALRIINTPDLKLLTAEDPVEYELEGIMQVPVNHAVGLTFAAALRSFLRQDPDVIMLGEVRDLETAQISIQASLTGHLVLSTLHTNDSAGAVTRLIDMGVEPFLLASTVEAVLAQRLVRRLCTMCKKPYEPPASLLQQLHLDPLELGKRDFQFGKGCASCNNSGYRGRVGLFEWLRMTEAMRELIVQRSPTLKIKQQAIEQGMSTLRQDGLRNIFNGVTSIEEIIKCT